MSWEDDLSAHRSDTASHTRPPSQSNPRRTSAEEDEEDPFAAHESSTTKSTFASNRAASNSNNKKKNDSESHKVYADDIDSHPLMQPPVLQSDALQAAILASRNLSADQRSLKDSLLAHRREEQERRIAHSEAYEATNHHGSDDNGEESASALIDRLDRLAKQQAPSAPSRSAFRSRIPDLSQIQKDLLDSVNQPEPPQRLLQLQPLTERVASWMEEYSTSGDEELTQRLKMLHTQYLQTRTSSVRDTKRMWQTSQTLHTLSVKLASIAGLKDFDTLERQLSSAPKLDPAQPGYHDPTAYFYDLYSLDLDSYADIKHLHSSSIVDQVTVGTGWWRTQLAELEEDVSAKRRKDAELLKKIEAAEDELGLLDTPRQDRADGSDDVARTDFDHLPTRDGVSLDLSDPSRRSGDGLLLPLRQRPGEVDLMQAELHQARLIGAASRRLDKSQLLAREQGRSYHSLSAGKEIMLPEGQRILQPKKKSAQPIIATPTRTHSQHDDLLDEINNANVNKPQRNIPYM